jgi:hypothetical protein
MRQLKQSNKPYTSTYLSSSLRNQLSFQRQLFFHPAIIVVSRDSFIFDSQFAAFYKQEQFL